MSTEPAPRRRSSRAALRQSASVAVGRPVSTSASDSLGHTMSQRPQSSSGSFSVGAGAALKMVVTPAARALRRAASVVATGTSSCVRSTAAPSKTPSGTSAGARRPFAPGTTIMVFSPCASTVISATPVAASGVDVLGAASTPRRAKLSRVASPKESAPVLQTILTRLPSSDAATAWLAPLPPKSCSKLVPMSVSPGAQKRGAPHTRSTFAEPTTTTDRGGCAIRAVCCEGSEAFRAVASRACRAEPIWCCSQSGVGGVYSGRTAGN
mmetsp:Transcript_19376/g.57598  ORF Transcript_19376/g.57598 Transcript_19376/m.57598 type:complete len:267 (-) Transcript_19376:100-900(-)